MQQIGNTLCTGKHHKAYIALYSYQKVESIKNIFLLQKFYKLVSITIKDSYQYKFVVHSQHIADISAGLLSPNHNHYCTYNNSEFA